MLNLKDENIVFEEEFCKDVFIDNVTAKIFDATLSYVPKACYHCNHAFDEGIIKHGFKLSLIKLPKVSAFDTYLKLKKQRYYCKHCNRTFTLETSVVKKNCFISISTKLGIALSAKTKVSEKDIGHNFNVSHSTVNRVIDSFYDEHKPNFNYLPKHLCFDEFKSVKASSGAMSFIFCNSTTGKIIDIVEDRRLHSLQKYFLRFSRAARHSVKTIVIDMYSPYISLIKIIFPKAKVIIDKFHIIQLFSRALNKTRIRIMNEDKDHYNKFKRYWKLLLKDSSKINYSFSKYNYIFKKPMREIDIINYLLELSRELQASYQLYQDIRFCIETKNIDRLFQIINSPNPNISDYMQTSIKTLKKYSEYIINTLNHNYNNGILEGIINKIKVIKRIAFGYRSFYHFKNRILITQNIAHMKTT